MTTPAQVLSVPRVPPLDRPVGALGLLLKMARNPLATLPAAIYEEGYVLGALPGRRRVLVIADPALVETALVGEADTFPKSPSTRRIFEPAFGDGLLTAEGASWRTKRRLAAPAFAPSRIRGYVPDMAAPFAALGDAWAAEGRPGVPVDAHRGMTDTTFDVILTTLFSADPAIDRHRLADAIDNYLGRATWLIAYAILQVPDWLPRPGRRRMEAAAAAMRNAVRRFIESRRALAGEAPRDLAADLMAAEDRDTGVPLSDDDLVDMLLTLIAAGHETSANALAWALHILSHQPQWQERLAAEVQSVCGSRSIGPDDPGRMVLTERFIKEVMRLYPPAAMLARVAARPIRLGGFDLSPGDIVSIPIYAIHRNRLLWERPDEFDPDRFTPEAQAARPRTAYMPFGAGPRVCLGGAFAMLELVTALATLMQRVRVAPVLGPEPEPVSAVTLRPKGGLRLLVAPR